MNILAKSSPRWFLGASFALTLIGLGGSGFPLTALGDPLPRSIVQSPAQPVAQKLSLLRLPPDLAEKVMRRAMQHFGATRSQIKLTSASPQLWPDGCLGLGSPVADCMPGSVSGWLVQVTDGLQTVDYRTDQSGDRIVSAANRTGQKVLLPRNVALRLMERVGRDTNQRPVTIVAVKAKQFDGCLGIYRPGQACQEILLQGWQVIVASPIPTTPTQTKIPKTYIYHLDKTATRIAQNTTATIQSPVTFLPWEEEQLGGYSTPRPATDVVFESVVSGDSSSGEASGRMTTLQLTQDGKLTRLITAPHIRSRPVLVRNLSRQQVAEFERLLQRAQFANLDGLSYLPSKASAGGLTTEFNSRNARVQFLDVNGLDVNKPALPQSIQLVLTDWQRLSQ
jgi:hypothetical protein